MKRILILFLLLLCSTQLFSCAPVKSDGYESFSYLQNLMEFSGNPGVRDYGFKNVTKYRISDATDAVTLAKNEVTVNYNQTDVYFDKQEKVWLVVFSKKNYLGGDQSVYLSSDGITLYCVYGE